MPLRAMQIPPLFQKKFEPPPRNEILDTTLAVGIVADFDVTFAYINFRLKGFPGADFQHGDGYTESH